jgi:hypothetical protein
MPAMVTSSSGAAGGCRWHLQNSHEYPAEQPPPSPHSSCSLCQMPSPQYGAQPEQSSLQCLYSVHPLELSAPLSHTSPWSPSIFSSLTVSRRSAGLQAQALACRLFAGGLRLALCLTIRHENPVE